MLDLAGFLRCHRERGTPLSRNVNPSLCASGEGHSWDSRKLRVHSQMCSSKIGALLHVMLRAQSLSSPEVILEFPSATGLSSRPGDPRRAWLLIL